MWREGQQQHLRGHEGKERSRPEGKVIAALMFVEAGESEGKAKKGKVKGYTGRSEAKGGRNAGIREGRKRGIIMVNGKGGVIELKDAREVRGKGGYVWYAGL